MIRQIRRIRHPQLAADTMGGAFPPCLMHGATKVRQDLIEAPAFVTGCRPVVIILLCAANVEHGVDTAGTAECLTGIQTDFAPVEMSLRCAGKMPMMPA